jgi:3-hydroxyacyl-CoA dehydrogenase
MGCMGNVKAQNMFHYLRYLTRKMGDAVWLGRKVGKRFYEYRIDGNF